jgi:hypothetical protein
VTAALAAAAGLAIGMQIDAGHVAAGYAPQARFATQDRAIESSVPFAARPVLLNADPTHRTDAARECETGNETDCIYL